MTTVVEQVRALIERLWPAPIRDDCIPKTLGLSGRQHANHKTRELAGMRGLERIVDRCSVCGGDKKVIRSKPR
jgi:hypothetical protein